MKKHSEGTFVVDEYGCIKPVLIKTPEFSKTDNKYTSGHLKYLDLPEGTHVRVTVEVFEESDDARKSVIRETLHKDLEGDEINSLPPGIDLTKYPELKR